MSLNTAHANGGVLIFNGEVILLYCDGVELHMDGEDAKDFRGTKKGRIYLTSHRMIFVNKSEKDPLQSFSFPFFTMKSINLEQPIFGANFIKGIVMAQAGGNFTGSADFKLKFNTGGAIEFGQAMLQAAKMASRYMPPQPPPYMPSQGPYYPAQPPAYMPPSGNYHGFTPPTHVFPNAPPANSVFTSDMPPPYPGIYPPPYGYPSNGPGYPQGNAPSYPQGNAPGYPQGNTPGYPQGNAPGYNQGNAPPPGYGAPGAYGYAQGPPPVGFNSAVNGMPPNAAMYNGGGAPAAPQAAYNNAGGGEKTMAYGFQDPTNPSTCYTFQNAYNPHVNNFQQEPPPPYFEPQKKDQ